MCSMYKQCNMELCVILALDAENEMQNESTSTLLQQYKNEQGFVNDPSAGSPTETLLRLLLPLNDQVCPTSQDGMNLAIITSRSKGLTKPFNR